jgi:hypothetical protein
MDTADLEWAEGRKEVGISWWRNLEWIVRFSATDLASLDHAERLRLWRGLLALAVLAARGVTHQTASSLTPEESHQWKLAAMWPIHPPYSIDRPVEQTEEYQSWWNTIQESQRDVKGVLHAAAIGDSPLLPIKDGALRITPRGLIPVFPFAAMRPHADGTAFLSHETALMVRLGQIFHRHPAPLAYCRKCRELFIRKRLDKRFCSDTCRSAHGMREKRTRDRVKKAEAESTREHRRKGGRTDGTKRRQRPRHR